MNITITGRHMNVGTNLQNYAEKKIKKLENYFNQLIDAHIILYVEKLDHGAEVIINGDGVQFHGREKADTAFSAIDLLFEKMEKQIIKYKEKHSSHKGDRNEPKGVFYDFEPAEGDNVRLEQVSNKPLDKIEAFLQMKNDESDFILFKQDVADMEAEVDYSNKCYATIFKQRDKLKMVEVPFESYSQHRFEHDTLVEYDLDVLNDSPGSPDIKFNKCSACSIKQLTLDEALAEIETNGSTYLPFFNKETQYFNIVHKKGQNCEVMVPAF
jgi:putative sigma-54 modulation protein